MVRFADGAYHALIVSGHLKPAKPKFVDEGPFPVLLAALLPPFLQTLHVSPEMQSKATIDFTGHHKVEGSVTGEFYIDELEEDE